MSLINLNFCTIVLIAIFGYVAFSNSLPLQHHEQQAAKKQDMPNRISLGTAEAAPLYMRSQQSSHVAAEHKDTRQKREYKELNDIIDELEESSYAQKAAAQAVQAQSAQVAASPQDYDLDNMPALTYYLLLQKLRQLQSNNEPTYRVRTPRLGRSIDFQQMLDTNGADASRHVSSFAANNDENGGDGDADGGSVGSSVTRQFVSRIMKKSVPFKPRLGKRAQVCGSNAAD